MASPNFHRASHSPVKTSVIQPKMSTPVAFSIKSLVHADGLP